MSRTRGTRPGPKSRGSGRPGPESRDRLGGLTAVAASVIEAWSELRVHRGRVLLSLIGVAMAVAALTTVVSLGAVVQQSTTESFERSGGKPATIVMQPGFGESGPTASTDDLTRAFGDTAKRYGVKTWTRHAYGQVPMQLPDGVADVQVQGVDPAFGGMHLVQLLHGTWFTESDRLRLAPALVVNPAFYAGMGSPDLRSHPTVMLEGANPVIAVILGVAPIDGGAEPSAYLLFSDLQRQETTKTLEQNPTQFEAWVPADIGKPLAKAMQQNVNARLDLSGPAGVTIRRQDYLAYSAPDPLLPLKLVVGGVAVLILLLGALSLLTVSLVTVRQRIREIGIRRSFGATAPRVFFSVMMESVVATGFAGVIGVALAIFVVQNPFVRDKISQGATDLPGFPVSAALLGIAVSVGIGALAGLLPALVAVRVKVIDAIRY